MRRLRPPQASGENGGWAALGRGRNGGRGPGRGGQREGGQRRAGLASLLSGLAAFGCSAFAIVLSQQRGLRPAERPRAVPGLRAAGEAAPGRGSERGAELCAWFSPVCSGCRRGWPPASCAAAKRRSGWIPTKPTRSPTLTRVSDRRPRPCCASLVLPSGKGMRQGYGKQLSD